MSLIRIRIEASICSESFHCDRNTTINCQTNQLMVTTSKKQKSRLPPQAWEPIPEMSSESGRALEKNSVFVSFNRTEQVKVQKGTILGVALLCFRKVIQMQNE